MNNFVGNEMPCMNIKCPFCKQSELLAHCLGEIILATRNYQITIAIRVEVRNLGEEVVDRPVRQHVRIQLRLDVLLESDVISVPRQQHLLQQT